MFNKTSIAKKTRLIYKSSKKFRKTLIINRKIKLKNSLENSSKNDYSLENNSNIYIKTSAQSKVGSESKFKQAEIIKEKNLLFLMKKIWILIKIKI